MNKVQTGYSIDIDEERAYADVIYRACASLVPDRLHFLLKLKGLSFGGTLDDWEIVKYRYADRFFANPSYYADRASASPSYAVHPHDYPIIVDQCRIRFSHNPLDPEDPWLHQRMTAVVRAHYSKDYVVATNQHYYYLGRRELSHNHFSVESEPYTNGNVMFSLIDHGKHNDRHKVVGRCMVSDTFRDLRNDDTFYDSLRDEMLARYKQEIRLGR